MTGIIGHRRVAGGSACPTGNSIAFCAGRNGAQRAGAPGATEEKPFDKQTEGCGEGQPFPKIESWRRKAGGGRKPGRRRAARAPHLSGNSGQAQRDDAFALTGSDVNNGQASREELQSVTVFRRGDGETAFIGDAHARALFGCVEIDAG